jgi:mono/diheme cytochrome c family protein
VQGCKTLGAIMKNIILLILGTSIFISCAPENNNQSSQEKQETTTKDTVAIKDHKSGQRLFKKNCSPCHGENEFVVAYPFQKIREDYDLNWIFSFIRNSDSLIKSGDIRATFVYDMHNQSLMSKFKNLTDQQIIDILDYVDTFPIINTYNDHRKLPLKSMEDSIKKWEDQWKKEEKGY